MKKISKFSGESGGKLGASIKDESGMKSKFFEDLVEKEISYSGGVDGFVARREHHPLTKSMVDYNHQRIIHVGHRKISNEVDRNLLERE